MVSEADLGFNRLARGLILLVIPDKKCDNTFVEERLVAGSVDPEDAFPQLFLLTLLVSSSCPASVLFESYS